MKRLDLLAPSAVEGSVKAAVQSDTVLLEPVLSKYVMRMRKEVSHLQRNISYEL